MSLTPDEIRENKAMSAWAVARANAQQASAARSHRLLASALVIAAIVVVSLFRFAMQRDYRTQETDADREARAVLPTDEYSHGIHAYAAQMCQCHDRACGRDVAAQVAAYGGHATDAAAQRSVDASLERLRVCQNLLEK